MGIPALLVLALAIAQTPASGILASQESVLSVGKSSIPSLLAQYQELIRKEPRNPEGYVLAAGVYPRPESVTLYRKAIEVAPDFAPAHLGLARHFSREERYAEAFASYQKALALVPEEPRLRLETVSAAVKGGRLDEAKMIAGADPDLRAEVVQALMDRGDRAGAERQLAEFGFDRADSGIALALRGRLSLLQGKGDQAQSLLLESWKKSPELMLHYRWVYPRDSLVQILTKSKRPAEAAAVARKGTELYPGEYPLYEAAWKALFMNVKPDYSAERKQVQSEIGSLLANHQPHPELYKVAALGYTMASLPAEADRMNQKLVTEFPYSQAAMWQKRSAAIREKDLRRRAALLEEFNRDFPAHQAYNEYLKTLDELKVPDAEILNAVQSYFDLVPYKYLPIYEAAPILLRRPGCLDRLRAWMEQIKKPAGAPIDAWDIRILTFKGKLLLLLDQPDEAERTLRPLIGLERQGISNVDKGHVKFRLAEVLDARQKYDEALDMYAQAYAETQHYYAEAGDKFRALYRRLKGSEAGMDDFLSIREGMYQVAQNLGIERGTRMNKPAPAFNLLNLKGERISLSSLLGKVVVLNFWATWCGPCIQELPHLQEFYERNKNKSKIAVLAVTTDENRALVEPFIQKNKYTFSVLFDEGLRGPYEVRGIPTTYIIDPAGNLRVRMVGFNTNEKLVPYLEQLVSEFSR